MSHFQNKAIIITGSSGIAAAAARIAAAGGAHLVLASSDEESAWELAAETRAECWVGDLTRPQSAASVLSQCLSKFGRVDWLFNAAGLSGRRFGDGPAHECTAEGWNVTIGHNLTLTFQFCHVILGRMLQQELSADGIRGCIVNTGSVLTQSPEPRQFALHAYAAAKGGIEALTRSMAAYYAPHKIRINAIAPGMVRTAASERARGAPELAELIGKKQALAGGMIDPEQAARAALYLLSGDSGAVTGQVLAVDGGWSVTGA